MNTQHFTTAEVVRAARCSEDEIKNWVRRGFLNLPVEPPSQGRARMWSREGAHEVALLSMLSKEGLALDVAKRLIGENWDRARDAQYWAIYRDRSGPVVITCTSLDPIAQAVVGPEGEPVPFRVIPMRDLRLYVDRVLAGESPAKDAEVPDGFDFKAHAAWVAEQERKAREKK